MNQGIFAVGRLFRRLKLKKFPVFSLMIRDLAIREQFAADCVIRCTVCRYLPQSGGNGKRRAESGIRSVRGALEKACLCRFRPLRPISSLREMTTVRFAAAGAFRPIIAALHEPARRLNFDQGLWGFRMGPRQGDRCPLPETESVALLWPHQRQVNAVKPGLGADLGGLPPLADRFHNGGCYEGQASEALDVTLGNTFVARDLGE
jgi:hypothetical protein